jgi:pimeloyl-ACP methyl ester carboxylesterase
MAGVWRLPWLAAGAVGLGALAWGGLVALLAAGQDHIIFPAPQLAADQRARLAAAAGARELHPATEDGATLYAWHVPASGKRAVLYFHGNGESAAFTGALARDCADLGWDFVAVSPRGYPGTTGRPAAGSIARDAQAAWQLVTDTLGFAPGSVVLHGRSLGGGLAGTLIADIEPAGVVFESTFLSIERLAQERFPFVPVGRILHHPARTEDRAPQLRAPALVLHGARDEVIPVSHGRRLAALLPQAEYVELADRGHNDHLLSHPEAAQAWRRFLAARTDG